MIVTSWAISLEDNLKISLDKIAILSYNILVTHRRLKNQEEVTFMKNILIRLVNDFNSYSELVALNRAQMKEGKCDDSILQWNRGHLNQIEEYLKEFAENARVILTWEFKEHVFGFDDWKRILEYRTVSVDESLNK